MHSLRGDTVKLKLHTIINNHIWVRWWPLRAAALLLGLLALGACKANQSEAPAINSKDARAAFENLENPRMWMTVNERRFAITLADTNAARAFAAQLPLALAMADLNGNEKHADLPQALPADASRPGTIQEGDLMLYGANTVVVFYEAFHSSYSYTRLGRVDDPTGLVDALGQGGVRVVFSAD